MKHLCIALIALFTLQAAPCEAQIFDKIKKKVSKKKDQEIDKTIDKGIDGIFGKKKKKKDKNGGGSDDGSSNEGGPVVTSETSDKKAKEIWMKRYDFKPGRDIIFYDDFENEEQGEIPSKWKYYKGLMEVVTVNNEHNNVMSGELGFGHPNWEEGFTLPESYTIEFDVFLTDPNAPNKGYGSYSYSIVLYGPDRRKEHATIWVSFGSISIKNVVQGKVPNMTAADYANTWNHISISVNGNSVKAYFNDYRVFNTRLADGAQPAWMRLWNCCQTTEKPVFLIDNFTVSAGAHPKYKEEILGGRIVTNNIHFETGSAEIIPRSFAEVKRIADVMKAHPEKNFNIEGHTDNVGDDASNLDLSNRRAQSVRNALIDMGIAEERLFAVGFGEAIPLEDNATPEGRAMNRRVEFIVQ
ncbi:MAG: OmpA family protein [Bacteroidota bacterium]